jgi:transcriptional regulator with GAF, ATPase, and Fis domain
MPAQALPPIDTAHDVARVRRVHNADDKAQNRSLLQDLMSKHRGSIHAVARELGKDRVQIRRWVKAYDIDLDQFRMKAPSR